MIPRLILSALLLALLAALSGSVRGHESPVLSQERVAVCPDPAHPEGWLVTLRSGRVLYYCQDGVYTPEQVESGRTWDEGEK